MQIQDKISTFAQLGNFLLDQKNEEELNSWFVQARNTNGWFTPDNCKLAVSSIAKHFLQADKLEQFVSAYNLEKLEPKKVGIVAAGNIPLVGLHDLLCTVLTGHMVLLKLSREDTPLMLNIINKLFEIEPAFKPFIQLAERLNAADAFIATGSDNSSRYFEYYFKSKPNIIRKNRTSVAVLDGNESGEDLRNLGNDMFQYFGLGCRNVSKVWVPVGYKFDFLYESIEYWNTIQLHHKYNNNYDYNKSIYLVNRVDHLDNGFLLIKEDDALVSPLSVLYHSTYNSEADLTNQLEAQKDKIQCLVGNKTGQVPFGVAQTPSLTDFSDGVDTMSFLLTL